MTGTCRSRPSITTAAGRPVVLAAGKGGFVFAFDPASGKLLWKTSVGMHNGHDDDDQLALDGKLNLQTPYTLYPGEIGGVETNMAAADGVVYVPVVNVPTTYTSATAPRGHAGLDEGSRRDGRHRHRHRQAAVGQRSSQQMPLGGATVSNDLVFTTTFNGERRSASRARMGRSSGRRSSRPARMPRWPLPGIRCSPGQASADERSIRWSSPTDLARRDATSQPSGPP